ncbi:hypothetical protein [Rhizobium sp. IMFF44]|uniref:hypothetical protein n=1 Tax=Rhizobium sp. IMFF44 TaxID=3342350 RepID=UPI0035BA70CB
MTKETKSAAGNTCGPDNPSFRSLSGSFFNLSLDTIVGIYADGFAAAQSRKKLAVVHDLLSERTFSHASCLTIALDTLNDGLVRDHGPKMMGNNPFVNGQ